jgi:hypothetical protein
VGQRAKRIKLEGQEAGRLEGEELAAAASKLWGRRWRVIGVKRLNLCYQVKG